MFLNISKLCRLCLLKDGTMSAIFNDESNSATADRVMACISIEVLAGDGLPQQICHKCLRQVNKWYKFRELCKNADMFLRQYMNKVRQDQGIAAEIDFISNPTPDMLLLPLFRVRSHQEGVKDEPGHSEDSSASFNNEDNLQECQENRSTEHYFGTWAEALLDNADPPKRRETKHEKDVNSVASECDVHLTGSDSAGYKCCKGRHPCVVFHPEEKQKGEPFGDLEAETFVNENMLLVAGTAASGNTYNGDVIKCQMTHNHITDNKMGKDKLLQDDNILAASLSGECDRTYTCHKCGNTYALDINLSFHLCHFMNSKSYVCNVCGNEFATIKTMRCHAAYHTGKYQCETCGNYFSAEAHRAVHMRKHTGENPHVCNLCGKTFMYSNSLVYHLNIHSGENSFVCDICGHRSFSKGNFERHKASHTKIKPHMCEICGKAFTVNVDLKRHRLTHSNDKNFTCDICDKRFKTAAILTNHQRLHSGERPFSCDVCGKRFARNDGLKEHRLTHTGEKRHSCTRCGKQFTWSKGLRKHKCDPINL